MRLSQKQREERARLSIIRDLIMLDLLTLKPISVQRETVMLPAVTVPIPVYEQETGRIEVRA